MAGVLAGGLLGCAASRRTEGSMLLVPAKGYRIALPAGWERIDIEADLALRHRVLGVALMAHGTCGGKTPGRPLPILARHLRFGLRDVREVSQHPAEVGGQPAIRSRLAARLDGVPVLVEALTLQARGCAYDLVVVAPPGRSEAATEAFERFVAGFGLGEGAR